MVAANERTPVASTLPCSVAEVCPDIYAVGGVIAAELPSYIVPRGLVGHLPVQCYVLRSGASSLILDTGLTIHRDAIRSGLSEVLSGSSDVTLLVSRWEPDVIINLPWMLANFPIRSMYSIGELNPLDFFVGFDQANASAQMDVAAGNIDRVPVGPGAVIEVGEFRLEILRACMQLLLVNWFYEHNTRTLFTSDGWGFMTHPTAQGPFSVQPSNSDISVERVRNAIRRKFDWLSGADCRPVIDDLRTLKDARLIDRICPTYGGVIEGAAAVDRLFANTIEALDDLGREPQRSVFSGFELARARNAPAVVDVERLPRPRIRG